MRHGSLAAASIILLLLAAPALAGPGHTRHEGDHWNNGYNGNKGDNRDHGDHGDDDEKGRDPGNLTTPSPEAAIGLPALAAAGVGAIVYFRSRRRKAT